MDELSALCDAAHQADMLVHMDGARFANAAASLGKSPAEITWKAGVDVLCFGGTKNGCIAAEAVIFFDRARAKDFEFMRKRAGHLWSKMRFIAAQFDAYLEDGLWLRLAAHANAMAQRLAGGLRRIDGVEFLYPVDINEQFVVFPDGVADRLRDGGDVFYPWVTPGDPADGRAHRLICSFRTTPQEADDFIQRCSALAAKA